MKIEEIELEKLIPYEFNNKIHDATQINRIANSIREFWFLQPLVIDKNNVLIVGHGRLEWAKKLWLKTAPCLRAENLTEEQIKKYRILDNKLNESEWDVDNLKLELSDLWDLNIWELELSIEELFPELNDKEEQEIETVEDEAPEVKEAKIVKGGGYLFLRKPPFKMLRFYESRRCRRFIRRRRYRYSIYWSALQYRILLN